MRKFVLSAVVILGLLSAPPMAAAYGPPIENLAPANGSTVQVVQSQDVQVELPCPAYGSAKAGTGYLVKFASSAELNPEGEFATPFLKGFAYAQPINAAEDLCKAALPSYDSERISVPTTYYWRVERDSCPYYPLTELEECQADSKGPIWSFTLLPPVKPTTTPVTTTPKAPTPPTTTSPGTRSARIKVYIGCGASKATRASYTCRRNQTIGAFLKSPTATRYTVCVKFPEGQTQCARNQRAEAETLYVNTIKRHKAGFYTVTWVVEGRHYVRRVHRTL